MSIEAIALVVGALGLIPVGHLVYTRLLRSRHALDVHLGNVILSRVVSANPARNGKLAVALIGVSLVNRGPDSVTLKSAELRYRFEGRRRAELESAQVGSIEGKDSVVIANAADRIVVAWEDLRAVLSRRIALSPGGILSGCALFFLDVPADRYGDIGKVELLVTDYSGGDTSLRVPSGPAWSKGIEKGMALVDAPARKDGEVISWDGIVLGRGDGPIP